MYSLMVSLSLKRNGSILQTTSERLDQQKHFKLPFLKLFIY